jgi:hypothetical protein
MIVESQISKTPFGVKVQMPILFNVPIYSKLMYTNEVINVKTCEEVISFNLSGIYMNLEKMLRMRRVKISLGLMMEITQLTLLVFFPDRIISFRLNARVLKK